MSWRWIVSHRAVLIFSQVMLMFASAEMVDDCRISMLVAGLIVPSVLVPYGSSVYL